MVSRLWLIVLVVACFVLAPVRGAYSLGYTQETCDNLRPQHVIINQDPNRPGQPTFGSSNFGSSQQGGNFGNPNFGTGQVFNPNQARPGGFNNPQIGQNNPGFNSPQMGPNPNNPGVFNPAIGQNNPNFVMNSNVPAPDGQNIQPILMPNGPNMPYRIWTSEARYKRGKVMEVRLEGEFFEAFILQARSSGGGPYNKLPQAGVGRFVGAPQTTMFLNCFDRSSSAVVNAPTPVRMNNLTFNWEAPFAEVGGDIFFIASVLLNDRYWILTSTPLSNNPFPGDLVGCGVRRTCVRLCGNFHGNPVCSLDEAEYVLIIDVDSAGREAMFTLGGRIRNPETYVSFGMANSDFSLTDMDMSVCMVDQGRVSLMHYYVKQEILPPYPHAGVLIPDLTDMDSEYIWCRFRRPLSPYGPTAINPARAMFHYYFKGPKNQSGIFLPHSIYEMNISPYPHNITSFYTDVQLSNGSPLERLEINSFVSVLMSITTFLSATFFTRLG